MLLPSKSNNYTVPSTFRYLDEGAGYQFDGGLIQRPPDLQEDGRVVLDVDGPAAQEALGRQPPRLGRALQHERLHLLRAVGRGLLSG